VAYVVLEVEVLVLHPPRVIQVEWHPHHSLAEGLGEVDPGGQELDEVLEAK